ncbi:MAG: glutamine synthetase type III [Bacteroidetes bacterium]|nr:glutamine synthetase type III [Bacteroidota bacterium]
MDNMRFKALAVTMSREAGKVDFPDGMPSEYFGSQTFSKAAMRSFLSEEAFQTVMAAVHTGARIDRRIADQIAASMKAWAVSKGATHYTHWFLPLTGSTAEKHDAFVIPTDAGKAIENFQGSELVQQEPDASSFPSGGIRNTFEARGYTAWDPTSPAFIMDRTLCIPTIFVSYTGEALDFKTPLLKALNALDKAAVSVCRYFGRDVNKVNATLGWEQEYFLVDTALFMARPDLALTGRTLFGHSSARDQQLEDHYFGVIPERVMAFMQDFEIEAHKLGIPVRTRHNEVAPNQFECAPVFEEANLAVDHNQLLMHLLDRVAKRHHFTLLLHEKPYQGVNGSGKHNNWSMMTNTGENLLSPGKTYRNNLRFLAFLVNVIKAVNNYPDLLRAYIASAGNDHRLGANEAPPGIISVFIGAQLSKTLEALEKNPNMKRMPANTSEMRHDIPKIPEILQDNTDRNRTSPFAFTGNKFEFRAVGSSQNCAKAMIALNLIVADQLIQFKKDVDALLEKKMKKEDAIIRVLHKYIQESTRIRFEGNNYGDEWIKEALQRGLNNFNSTPEALEFLLSEPAISLFNRNRVLNEKEIHARYEIEMENYIKKIQIESRVIGDLASNHIIPIAIKYQNMLVENVKGLKEVLDVKTFGKLSYNQLNIITEISEHVSNINHFVAEMTEARKVANAIPETREKAYTYLEQVKPFFEKIRYHVDRLEMLVDDELWPLPKYRELLFVK